MTTTNTIASRLKPLIFITGITLGLVALCAIVLTLTWTALVTSQDNSVFAKSQSASQLKTRYRWEAWTRKMPARQWQSPHIQVQ